MDEEQKGNLLARWQSFPPSFSREVEEEISPFLSGKNAVFLYGPRRAGKSTIAQRLVKTKPYRYLNFDDPFLPRELDASAIETLCSGLAKGAHLVLDEVQNVSAWERWVRSCVDHEWFHVLVTGSSGKLLSSEFASSLAGRGIGFLVLPLSFREFSTHYSKKLEDYLQLGGYPEVIKTRNRLEQQKLLDSYFELTILKDVVARYSVRDVGALTSLATFLLTNAGKTVSFRSLKHALGLSFDSIRLSLDHLEAAFLHFLVPHFAYSLKKSMAWPKKTYSFDLGLQTRISKSFSPDFGRKAENAVAIELKRRGFELYYWKETGEVDFVARKGAEITPINVCYSQSPAEREINTLLEFAKAFKTARTPLLLSLKGKEKTESENGVAVRLKNLKNWLLEKPWSGQV